MLDHVGVFTLTQTLYQGLSSSGTIIVQIILA